MNRAWWDRSVAIVLLFFALLASMARAGDELNRDVRIIIDTEKSIAKVAEDFIGFGYETSAVAQSGFFSPNNTRMINLYGNLSKHGMIRIGGNVSDHTRYIADGISAAKTEKEVTVINRANLDDLGAFVRATGWRVMWGLNLGTGTKDEAVEEAVAVNEALARICIRLKSATKSICCRSIRKIMAPTTALMPITKPQFATGCPVPCFPVPIRPGI